MPQRLTFAARAAILLALADAAAGQRGETMEPAGPPPRPATFRDLQLVARVVSEDGTPFPVTPTVQCGCEQIGTTLIYRFSPGSRTIGFANISVPGYRSQRLIVTQDRTVKLTRLDEHEGSTISLVGLKAPREARREFEKGMRAAIQGRWFDAQRRFEAAVHAYPEYASAWYELGIAHERQRDRDPALAAYYQALTADPRFMKPYAEIARVAAAENRWDDVYEITEKAIGLNAVEFPDIYYYRGVAALDRGESDEAEANVRRAIQLDTAQELTRAPYVLGLALALKGDRKQAAQYFREYIRAAPHSSEAEVARRKLREWN